MCTGGLTCTAVQLIPLGEALYLGLGALCGEEEAKMEVGEAGQEVSEDPAELQANWGTETIESLPGDH